MEVVEDREKEPPLREGGGETEEEEEEEEEEEDQQRQGLLHRPGRPGVQVRVGHRHCQSQLHGVLEENPLEPNCLAPHNHRSRPPVRLQA